MSILPINLKWLEILNLSGRKTATLTILSIIFLILVKCEIIETPNDRLWSTILVISAVVFGLLCMSDFLPSKVKAYIQIRNEKKSARNFIPYMTIKDRKIIGYLLYHNEKMFQHSRNGGSAIPLISKGIIRAAFKEEQFCGAYGFPFEIPDHIWLVLKAHQKKFPYVPPPDGETETETKPWVTYQMKA